MCMYTCTELKLLINRSINVYNYVRVHACLSASLHVRSYLCVRACKSATYAKKLHSINLVVYGRYPSNIS